MTRYKGKELIRLIVLSAAALVLLLLIILNLGAIGNAFVLMKDYLQYAFIRRALIVGVLVALCSALLGVILVLKRYSMIGDGLSHVGFGALTVAMAMGFVTADALPAFLPAGLRNGIAALCASIASEPMVFTLIIVILCAFLLLRMSEGSGVQGDSAIAILSTSALALGVVVTSVTSGMNVDVYNYMFGSILAMSASDVVLSVILCALVITLFILFYPRIFAVTFDEPFAKATGIRVKLFNMIIALLTAVTVVIGMRMMGTMLISSLLIFPALSAMRLFGRFKAVTVCAAAFSVVCFALGMMISCVCSLPTGACIVGVNLCVFLICTLIKTIRSR